MLLVFNAFIFSKLVEILDVFVCINPKLSEISDVFVFILPKLVRNILYLYLFYPNLI